MIKALFGTTVDSIVSDIRGKVEALHAVKEDLIAEAAKHSAKIDVHTQLRDAASLESDRAHRLATKFEELIS